MTGRRPRSERDRFVAVMLTVAALALVVAWWRMSGLRRDQPARPSEQLPVAGIGSRTAGGSLDRTFNPTLRVNLTPSPPQSLRLRCDGPFRVLAAGSTRELWRGDALPSVSVSATPNGLRIGNRTLAATRIEIVPDRDPAVWVDGHQYHGRLRLFRLVSGTLLAVNVLPLEDYLASVVDSEMPREFGRAARQAQAVAARTYALYQMQERQGHPYWDVYANQSSQKYLGVKYEAAAGKLWAGESEDSRSVVNDTRGMVCVERGRIFCTYYSAVCGGRTTPGRQVFSDAAACLQSVPCDWCREAERYRWTRDAPIADVSQQLAAHFRVQRQPFTQLAAFEGDAADLLQAFPGGQVTVSDGRHQYRLTRMQVRSEILAGQLPSPMFVVSRSGDELHFTGRGHGHGVGFCQWGARGQGQAGRDAVSILKFYYPGAEVVRLIGDTGR